MALPLEWNPRRAVESCDIVSLKQAVWRGHRRSYDALDHTGSLLRSARFHRAPQEFAAQPTWPALYTALDLAVALGEMQRNVDPDALRHYRFTELWVQLEAVVDCRDLAALGLDLADLFDDVDNSTPRTLASAAVGLRVEGMLVPSATLMGGNLIIFPHLVRSSSVLVPVRSIDPMLAKRTAEQP
ncbi:MAG: RES family NAD+ phosphorylase [Thermomicrobiales bacterium]